MSEVKFYTNVCEICGNTWQYVMKLTKCMNCAVIEQDEHRGTTDGIKDIIKSFKIIEEKE